MDLYACLPLQTCPLCCEVPTVSNFEALNGRLLIDLRSTGGDSQGNSRRTSHHSDNTRTPMVLEHFARELTFSDHDTERIRKLGSESAESSPLLFSKKGKPNPAYTRVREHDLL